MFVSSLKERGTPDRRWAAGFLLLTFHCLLIGCASSVQRNGSPQSPKNESAQRPVIKAEAPGVPVKNDEGTPKIVYDERGRIKGLFGLRTDPSGDPTCRLREYPVDFVNIERNEYLIFSLPSTFHVWVKVEGEMQKIFTDPQNTKAREFLSKRRKYMLKAYACDGIGHTSYETVSVELLD